MSKDVPPSAAEVLRRAQRILQQQRQSSSDRKQRRTVPPLPDQPVPGALARLIFSAITCCKVLLNTLFLPLWLWRRWRDGRLLTWVLSCWRWCAYQQKAGTSVCDHNGDMSFSPRRLVVIAAAGLASGWLLYLGGCALYFFSTQFEELVYTTGKQEIVAGERYQFTGCTSLPCSTSANNGKYYTIESSLFLPALYYPEEDVYANIPQQDAACTIKGYGIYFRRLRVLYHYAQWYQHVYNISCRPYTDKEKAQVVQSGVLQQE